MSSEDEVENSEDETLEGALDEEQSDNIEKNKKVRGSKISAKRKRCYYILQTKTCNSNNNNQPSVPSISCVKHLDGSKLFGPLT